jgi:hypothetical protein
MLEHAEMLGSEDVFLDDAVGRALAVNASAQRRAAGSAAPCSAKKKFKRSPRTANATSSSRAHAPAATTSNASHPPTASAKPTATTPC